MIGVGPHPGTTLPCPEFPMDLRKLPITVFCPMAILDAQLSGLFGYSMGNAPSETEPVERFDANFFTCVLYGNPVACHIVWPDWLWHI